MWKLIKKGKNKEQFNKNEAVSRDIHHNLYSEKLLDIDYRIIDGNNNDLKSRFVSGKGYNITNTGMWLKIPEVEIDGLHISFGHSNFVRNTIEVEFRTVSTDEFRVLAEVEWYEFLSRDGEYRFSVGIKFIKLTDYIKKRLFTISSYLSDNLK